MDGHSCHKYLTACWPCNPWWVGQTADLEPEQQQAIKQDCDDRGTCALQSMADEYGPMAYDFRVTHIVGGTCPQPGALSWLISIAGNQTSGACAGAASPAHGKSSQQPPLHRGPVRRMRMGTSQHEQVACWQCHVLFPCPLHTVHPVPGHCRAQMRDCSGTRLGLSHCFLAASSQYSWSFCLVKQKVGNCWPATADGSGPFNPFLHLSSRNTGTWHVMTKTTQLTELGPGAEVHQTEQLLAHQLQCCHQRNNITLLEWEQPAQCNPYLELPFVPSSMLTLPAMPLPGVPALQGVSSQRELVFLREQTWCTGRQVCLFQNQRQKSEPGCRRYGSGEKDQALSPKPDRKDIAAPLQRQCQALGKDTTLRQVRTDNDLLSAHSCLCSQLKGQVMSCRRPRSTSSMSSSEQQPVICGGHPHSQLLCWLPINTCQVGECYESLIPQKHHQPCHHLPNHLSMRKKTLCPRFPTRESQTSNSQRVVGGRHVELKAGASISIYIFQLLHIPAHVRWMSLPLSVQEHNNHKTQTARAWSLPEAVSDMASADCAAPVFHCALCRKGDPTWVCLACLAYLACA